MNNEVPEEEKEEIKTILQEEEKKEIDNMFNEYKSRKQFRRQYDWNDPSVEEIRLNA